jgi:hypothetical protein
MGYAMSPPMAEIASPAFRRQESQHNRLAPGGGNRADTSHKALIGADSERNFL